MRVATKAKRQPAPEVSGLEAQVDRARELRAQVESLQTELSIVEDELRAEALRRMRQREASGEVLSTLALQGTDGAVKVTRRNVFRKIAPHAEAHMREVLGDLFDKLFEPTVEVKVRKPMAKQLMAAAKACGLDLTKYASISEHIAPAKKWGEQRGALRPQLGERLNDELDELEDQIRQSTTVGYR